MGYIYNLAHKILWIFTSIIIIVYITNAVFLLWILYQSFYPSKGYHLYREAEHIINENISKYKKEIYHFNTMQKDVPHRIKNLNKLFDNLLCTKGSIVNFMKEKKIYQNKNEKEYYITKEELEDVVFLKSHTRKIMIIREMTYNYIFELLVYFCEKYIGSGKNMEYRTNLNLFHKQYKTYIQYENFLNYELRGKRYKSFSKMIRSFVDLNAILKHSLKENCELTDQSYERIRNIEDANNILKMQLVKMDFEYNQVSHTHEIMKFDFLINNVNDEFDRAIQLIMTEIDIIDKDAM